MPSHRKYGEISIGKDAHLLKYIEELNLDVGFLDFESSNLSAWVEQWTYIK